MMDIKIMISFLLICFIGLDANEIAYKLGFLNPDQHIANVEITLDTESADQLVFAIPAWAPGRYVIYNFSKNIFQTEAFDQNGKKLNITLLDKQSWAVRCKNAKSVIFKYNVFANTLDGTFSKITQDDASLNGPNVFMYVVGQKDAPINLTVNKPLEWEMVCPLPTNEDGSFHAKNYDQLIDSPIELGDLYIYEFDQLNKKHQMVFHQAVDTEILNALILDTKKVINSQSKIFGLPLPYDRYVFFFHLDKRLDHTDGMEHANSTRILLRMDINSIKPDATIDPDYDNLIWLIAHEYFHLWNIKRLRPSGLGPFDYTQEVYTPSLWIVEGLTSYFGYLSLIRSGIYDFEYMLSEFSGRINRYENSSGKMMRSLRDVSILTWLFKGYVPHFDDTIIQKTTYSYYYKGLIVALLLDLKIRYHSSNQQSLDSVMKQMYEVFYLQDRTYLSEDFEQVCSSIAGSDLSNFFNSAVRSTQALDYSALNYAGLELVKQNGWLKIVPLKGISDIQLEILTDWMEISKDDLNLN